MASVSEHAENNNSMPTTSDNTGSVLTRAHEDVGTHWNSSFDKRTEKCTASIEVCDDIAHQLPTTNNQHGPTSQGHVIPKSNDEKSIECNAFSVTSTAGNHALPNFLASSGSISSCSDEAAEELLTVAFKNQKLNERLALDSSLESKKQTMINDSTTNRSINKKVIKPSDVDCTVESTSYTESTTQSDNLPQQSNIHEPRESSSSIYRRMQFLNDKTLNLNFDNKKQDDITQYSSDEYTATESVDDKRIITVVHPTRHKPIHCDDGNESGNEYPQDMTSRSSSRNSSLSQGAIVPLSGAKAKSILAKNVAASNVERSTRFAQSLFAELETNNEQVTSNSVASTTPQSQPQLQRLTECDIKSELVQEVDNQSIVPSTIMERKTYIKKVCNKITSTGPRIVTTIRAPVHPLRVPPTSTTPTSQLAVAAPSSTSSVSASSSTPSLSSSAFLVTTTTISTPTARVSTDLLTTATTEQQVSPSKTTQTLNQPYKLFYSGTEIELGFNDIGSPLSECASPDSNPQQASLLASASVSVSALCESDNNLPHSSPLCPTMKLNGPSASLPSAIVHPLGLDPKHATKCSVRAAADRAALIETLSGASVQSIISSDERSSIEDPIDSCDNLTTASSSEGELDSKYKPEYMLQIYKELGDHLKTMGFKPKSEIKTKTRTKRLMNVASRFLETEEHATGSTNCSPEPTDDGDGQASLPFKKRRKLPVFNGDPMIQLIKEEECDSQPPSESPASLSSLHEMEVASAALPSPLQPPPPSQMPAAANIAAPVGTGMNVNDDTQPIAHSSNVGVSSYPPTPMLSIANIVEYLPVRAYSTFKTPAPEMAPVRFNILPQQTTMVINNAPQTNASLPSASNSIRSSANQHVDFGTTFNLIPPPQQPPSQSITSNQTNTLGATAATNANMSNNNNNMNCGIVSADGEYLTPSMQTIAPDNPANGFNVAQYHQTFHPNSPYAATYSIQPAHTNPSNLPPNFDIQNMFNLRNYQMNSQHYHNLLQNSRMNFQEKKSVLLNDYISKSNNNINESCGQENLTTQSGQHLQPQQQQQQPPPSQHHQHQHHQQQHQQQFQQHQLPSQHQTHTHIQPSVEAKATAPPNKTMAPRTKAARKMVAESVTVAAISTSDKLSATTKTNRVTRSSIRTTRAQHVSTEQKSPRRKTNRHR